MLFVAGIVLFIDHDQRQVRQAGKNGHARAQHNARLPAVRCQPTVQALRRGHAAVQADHACRAHHRGKALVKALLQLGCEVDFRHQHQHLGLWVGGQGLGGAVQIHLGFAAARAAKQQEWPVLGMNLGCSPFLLRGKRYFFRSILLLCGDGCGRFFGAALHAPRPLLGAEFTQ